jgi:flavodoxin
MKLYNMFFSATGTTKTIAREISAGTGIEEVIEIDLTLPNDREEGIFVSKDDLLLISMPVYVGMIPFMHNLVEYLQKLTTDGAKTVICVNYGTRHYEDAIRQIDEILTPQGFNTIAVAHRET